MADNDEAAAQEPVRLALRTAFRGVRPRTLRLDLSHEECVELRRALSGMWPQDVQFVLPRLLEDLMDTRAGQHFPDDNSDLLLQSLDVPRHLPEYGLALSERHAGPEAAAHVAALWEEARRYAAEPFELITREQAAAIARWLDLAATWRDFAYHEGQMQSARDYWSARAATPHGTPEGNGPAA